MVGNDRREKFRVGGDNTLLTKSDQLGASVAAEAAQMSQKAIDDLTRSGTTSNTVEAISALFPTKVWTDAGGKARARSLQDWHDEVLHEICREEIFPDVVDSFDSKVARAGQRELVKGGLTDMPAPPIPADLGDFVVPSGDRTMG